MLHSKTAAPLTGIKLLPIPQGDPRNGALAKDLLNQLTQGVFTVFPLPDHQNGGHAMSEIPDRVDGECRCQDLQEQMALAFSFNALQEAINLFLIVLWVVRETRRLEEEVLRRFVRFK